MTGSLLRESAERERDPSREKLHCGEKRESKSEEEKKADKTEVETCGQSKGKG